MKTRYCPRCKRNLPLSEFAQHTRKENSLLNDYCRSCVNTMDKDKAMLVRQLVTMLEPYRKTKR